jgi:hypothetical protein
LPGPSLVRSRTARSRLLSVLPPRVRVPVLVLSLPRVRVLVFVFVRVCRSRPVSSSSSSSTVVTSTWLSSSRLNALPDWLERSSASSPKAIGACQATSPVATSPARPRVLVVISLFIVVSSSWFLATRTTLPAPGEVSMRRP